MSAETIQPQMPRPELTPDQRPIGQRLEELRPIFDKFAVPTPGQLGEAMNLSLDMETGNNGGQWAALETPVDPVAAEQLKVKANPKEWILSKTQLANIENGVRAKAPEELTSPSDYLDFQSTLPEDARSDAFGRYKDYSLDRYGLHNRLLAALVDAQPSETESRTRDPEADQRSFAAALIAQDPNFTPISRPSTEQTPDPETANGDLSGKYVDEHPRDTEQEPQPPAKPRAGGKHRRAEGSPKPEDHESKPARHRRARRKVGEVAAAAVAKVDKEAIFNKGRQLAYKGLEGADWLIDEVESGRAKDRVKRIYKQTARALKDFRDSEGVAKAKQQVKAGTRAARRVAGDAGLKASIKVDAAAGKVIGKAARAAQRTGERAQGRYDSYERVKLRKKLVRRAVGATALIGGYYLANKYDLSDIIQGPAQAALGPEHAEVLPAVHHAVEHLKNAHDTISHHAVTHLHHEGIKHPNAVQIHDETQRMLDLNNLSWNDAEHMPKKAEFKV